MSLPAGYSGRLPLRTIGGVSKSSDRRPGTGALRISPLAEPAAERSNSALAQVVKLDAMKTHMHVMFRIGAA